MKRVFVLSFFVAAFAVAANAQRFGSTTCGLVPGPCMERYARQAYAPVDYYLNNGYGYGYGGYGYYGNGRIGTSALVGAASGAIAGGLVAYATTRNSNRVYAAAPNGEQYYAQPVQARFRESKPQKPLDCRKINSKNRVVCEAAAAELAEHRQATERQACLDQLATSNRRLRNGSAVFTAYPMVNGQPLMVCGKPLVLETLQTVRIFPPDGQISGRMFGAGSTGEEVEMVAKIQAVNRPGFVGWVLMAPGASGGGN